MELKKSVIKVCVRSFMPLFKLPIEKICIQRPIYRPLLQNTYKYIYLVNVGIKRIQSLVDLVLNIDEVVFIYFYI